MFFRVKTRIIDASVALKVVAEEGASPFGKHG